jgi:hypothetical protein
MRDDSAMALVFRRSRSDEPPGRELLRELIDHLDEIYPGRAQRGDGVRVSRLGNTAPWS